MNLRNEMLKAIAQKNNQKEGNSGAVQGFYLTKNMKAKFKAVCDADGVSMSEVVQMLIVNYIEGKNE
ncbi:MAG: hypothetical protein NVS1B10_05760 [Candidatus Saccharimonadales bacterium]